MNTIQQKNRKERPLVLGTGGGPATCCRWPKAKRVSPKRHIIGCWTLNVRRWTFMVFQTGAIAVVRLCCGTGRVKPRKSRRNGRVVVTTGKQGSKSRILMAIKEDFNA
jgi:hypothetical protein